MFCPVLSWCVEKLDRLGQAKTRSLALDNSTDTELTDEALENHDRAGERSIGLAQAAIGSLVLALHLISAYRHDFQTFSPLVASLLLVFVISSVSRVLCAGRSKFNENSFTVLTIVDSALLVGVIWAFGVAYNLPFETSVKSPTLFFLFTFVGLRALRFSCHAAMLSTVAVIGCWAAAFLLLAALTPTIVVARTYEEFLAGPAILVGAEFEKFIALFVLGLGIAIGARRGREVVMEIAHSQMRLHRLAHYDDLTGLPNRVHFRQHLARALARVRRGELVAVFCLDLDHFKKVNDTLGHPVGDKLLQAVGERLSQNVREVDTIARLGGDEFAIVQTSVQDSYSVAALAQRIIDVLRTPFVIDGHTVICETSVGIAISPFDGIEQDELLKKADLALNRSKSQGRSTYQFFEKGMDDLMHVRRQLEMDLREAMATDQLEVHYQPLVDPSQGDVSSFEALARWKHPEKGYIPPDQFISMAEEIGLISQLGEWVLRQACLDAATWPERVRVAVNLSPAQIKSDKLVQQVRDALDNADLCPSRLELEVTESILIEDVDVAVKRLLQLKELGVSVALDDFGTGYSSLSYLQCFPFDKIKVDRCFVERVSQDVNARSIVRAVMKLGSELGMRTTAEGVETDDQKQFLVGEGCSELQGFLFSTARPAAEVPALIETLSEKDRPVAAA